MTRPPRIAVIGLSTRYAGGVHSPDALWQHLHSGVDPIRDFPEGRWDRGFLNPDHDARGRSYIFAGGYLDDVAGFDAEFFGISPREAQQIDPQQRLLLELAWEALEDAGLPPERVAGSRTGVFIGLSNRDYGEFHEDEVIDAYTNLGLALSIASNRLSYVLDLKGPSFTVDTACSSGMVALHQAVQSLARGECDTALAGAANLLLSPKAFIGFAKASMLSPAGRCTTFDANGAGYVRAEGGGVLVLKRLDDAERDGDRILGVIAATGVNSDGRTMGIALPSADAQAALLAHTYAEAGVTPDEVYYVEAHGTGTAVGDPIECEAIARVLGGDRRGAEPLRVGSIKSNVGHLEPAAGIAGVTKVLLALRHREIPANLHFRTPNPKIDFAGWKLDVVAQHHPLPQRDKPLAFGVNSFGFGGTNGHAVILEYRPSAATPMAAAPVGRDATPWRDLLVLSAQSAPALQTLAGRWLARLQEPSLPDWDLLRANALHRRSLLGHRLALHAANAEEAAASLSAFLDGKPAMDTVAARAGPERTPVAFVYAGNGPQWWGMGRELLAADATFRNAVDAVDSHFRTLAGWSLIDELLRDEATSRMALTEVAQPTLFALQVGLTQVLRAAGLEADAVIGHSVGEAAAAWASGALSLQQATRVIHERSLAQSATAGMGKMAALGIGAEEARQAMAEVGGFLELAAINSPGAVTVAGDPAALEQLCQRLVDAGRFARVLNLDYAFHTRTMDGIRDGLMQGLDGLAPGETQRPFVSTVEGRVIEGPALGADYWWRNVREPVAFEAGVTHLLQSLQIGGCIEIGPHPVLRDYLLQTAKARQQPLTVLTTLRRPRGAQAEPEHGLLRQTISAAYAHGLADPRRLAAKPAAHVPLPLYPWQRQRHWRGANTLPGHLPPKGRDHLLLGWRAATQATLWENPLEAALLPWLADHVIQDAPVFPGAGYVEIALAAATALHGPVDLQLEDIDFLKPLVLPAGPWPRVHCQVDALDGTWAIGSHAGVAPEAAADGGTLHARGRLTRAEPSHRPPAIDTAAAWQALGDELSTADHYSGAADRGMHYGPAFQGVRAIRLDAEQPSLAHAWIELPEHAPADVNGWLSHPILLDSCLQVLITLMARREPRPCAFIPVRISRLRCFAPLPRRLFGTVEVLGDSPRSGSARFTLYDEAGACVMVLDETRFQKADLQAQRTPLRLGENWRPDPASPALATAHAVLPTPAAVAALLQPVPGDSALEARLSLLAAAYARDALSSLSDAAGISPAPFALATLQRRARLRPDMATLLRALADMAVAQGLVQLQEPLLNLPVEDAPQTAALWRELMLQAPHHHAALMLLAQTGEQLPQMLRGECEPLPLQGERSAPALESLLEVSPFVAPAHRLLQDALRAWQAQTPQDRELRVLELHAGAGACTAAALDALPSQGLDYVASDRDAGTVERLLHRLAGQPALRGLTLDLGDMTGPAALSSRFDLVICGDGLASCRLRADEALRRAAECVAPGGWLMLIAPRPLPASTLLLAAHPQAWRGGQSPLRDAQAWLALLQDTPWRAVQAVAAGEQTLLMAQRETETLFEDPVVPAASAQETRTEHWLLLLSRSEAAASFVERLTDALQARGQRVSNLLLDPTDDADALVQRLNSATGEPERIVHLAGLLADHGDPLAIASTRCLPLLALARLSSATLRLSVVTRGAMPAPAGGAHTLHPAQAPAWGMARVLTNENPSLATRLIDLHAPIDATLADRLADELLRDDAETEVLLDASGRWLQRVENAPARTRPAEAAGYPAARLFAAAQGGLDALHVAGVPRRAPAAGEVEIAVRAAGLNFRDVLWAMNMLPEEAVEHGFSGATIGMECAGEIVARGEGVTDLQIGDRVIGFASGCFASHVTTSAGAVARMPEGLSFEAAATLPTAFLTAHYALLHLARLEPGERVLIHGAAGGVGLAAVQIARQRGAVVLGTAGSPEKRRLLRLYGVDHVLDSRSLAFADDVMQLTGGQGLDVVLNSLAGEAITKNLQILRPFGRLLEIGKRDFYANSRIGLRPFRNNLSYFGIDADTLLVERPDLARRVFAEVAAEVAAGRLRPLPYQASPISRATRAFRLMQQSRHVGKIVVTLPATGEPLPAVAAPPWQARGDGTWLVTGGLGGFGLATARWLARRGVRALALVSRRGASTPEAQQAIAALRAEGVTVQAFAADVSRAEAVTQLLADIRVSLPPLRGIVHAAMVLDDAPMALLDRQRLDRVLAPKVAGAWELHRQTQGDALEAFVTFSSATVLIGNPGQGNYVAANQYLDALVRWRRAQGLPGLSVGWGAIADVGVVTRTEGLADWLEKRAGMAAMPSAEALAELGRALAEGQVCVTVAPLDMQRLGDTLPGARAARLAALAPARAADGSQARQTLAERWAATASDARRPIVLDTLREHLARILGTAAAQVDIERPLSDLGLDSLMAVELATALEREVGRPVSVMQMIQAGSAGAVADTLLASLEAATHG